MAKEYSVDNDDVKRATVMFLNNIFGYTVGNTGAKLLELETSFMASELMRIR